MLGQIIQEQVPKVKNNYVSMCLTLLFTYLFTYVSAADRATASRIQALCCSAITPVQVDPHGVVHEGQSRKLGAFCFHALSALLP